MTTEQDRQDARRVLDGDVAAFEGLVRRWQRPLTGLAYRFCRDRTEAEDMVQEAFLRVFRKLDRYDPGSPFGAWIYTVATRLFISKMRRRHPSWLHTADLERLPGSAGPAGPLEARERDELVRRAVLAMPERYRNALTLFYFHEQDLNEAARSLGVSTGTLKSRLHRGRELLRRRLEALPALAAFGEV